MVWLHHSLSQWSGEGCLFVRIISTLAALRGNEGGTSADIYNPPPPHAILFSLWFHLKDPQEGQINEKRKLHYYSYAFVANSIVFIKRKEKLISVHDLDWHDFD
jgi:hypothetical protein